MDTAAELQTVLPDKRQRAMDGYIVGAGGANFDIHIRTDKAPVLRDSNPGHLRTSAGGVCRNIMENLARQGDDCVLLSAVGSDHFGDAVLAACTEAGIDVSRVLRSDKTPTSAYIDILDDGGDMYLAANDMRLVVEIPAEYFQKNAELIRGAAAVVVDANLSEDQLTAIFDAAEGRTGSKAGNSKGTVSAGQVPVFADPVSAAKCGVLKPFLSKLTLIKPNSMELEALSGLPCGTDEEIANAAEELLRQGVKQVVVSLGERGCWSFGRGASLIRGIDCGLPVVNASGAGDAFMSGLVHSVLNGADKETMLHYALACGRIATLSEDTINYCLTEEYVFRFMDKYPVK
ncbi:MAG: carbohydrate kinase family protein [Clostridia bacterium]|nr:carbohydrate kinase family protein [Clostridia bacterium]